MVNEAVIVEGAKEYAQVIDEFARSRGWTRDDYHLLMRANADLATLSIRVVAREYGGRTEDQAYDDYDDLMDFIEERLAPERQAFNSFGLVLSGFDDFAFTPGLTWEPPNVVIDEKLINDGISWSEPSLPPHR